MSWQSDVGRLRVLQACLQDSISFSLKPARHAGIASFKTLAARFTGVSVGDIGTPAFVEIGPVSYLQVTAKGLRCALALLMQENGNTACTCWTSSQEKIGSQK